MFFPKIKVGWTPYLALLVARLAHPETHQTLLHPLKDGNTITALSTNAGASSSSNNEDKIMYKSYQVHLFNLQGHTCDVAHS